LSALEDKFFQQWQQETGIPLDREFSDIALWESDFQERYSKSKRSKRYRLDFAHPSSCTGIEVQGGVYMNGRHVNGSGYEKDCRKYNLASASGWTIFLLSATMTKDLFWHRLIASHIAARLLQPG
jgi:hypothetical protein